MMNFGGKPELEESFTFTSYDFDYSDEDEDDESYIEIAIQPTPPSLPPPPPPATALIPAVVIPPDVDDQDHHQAGGEDQKTTTTATSNSTSDHEKEEKEISNINCNTNNRRRRKVEFPAAIMYNRLLSMFLPGLKPSPSLENTSKENAHFADHDDHNRQIMAVNNMGSLPELPRNRKTSKEEVTTAINGGGGGVVMKLIIKFQSIIRIRSIITSFLKTVQLHQQQFISSTSSSSTRNSTDRPNKRRSSSTSKVKLLLKSKYRRLIKPLQKKVGDHDHTGTISGSSNINIDKMKKDEAQTRSSPSSIKSSPIHEGGIDNQTRGASGGIIYTRDNSVQAAIAHCKTSFAPNLS